MSTFKRWCRLIRVREREGYRFEVNAVGSVRVYFPPNWHPFRRDSDVSR